ncbi:MAG TPA: MBL fold metallo-hydrolase [Syntrophomonadaceae bacterium]|nr:MBL fold metallo-hydrolase [Syntrophomonadaceae bacterium]
MKIATGVEMLELSAHLVFGPTTIYPTLIWDKDSVILVDTGFPSLLPNIRQAIEEAGIAFNRLSHIIMTHHDIDHIGNLLAILREISHKVEVLAHKEEMPYIQGDLPPAKLGSRPNPHLEEHHKQLSEEQRQAVMSVFSNFKAFTAPVDQTLTDGEELPFCGGITVIHTPGHTPGHICLYLKESKTLITGDALFVENGVLVPAPWHLNHNNNDALQSLKKLIPYEVENIICYHGGLYQDHGGRQLAGIISSVSSD